MENLWLHPLGRYPDGHPHLANGLTNLGGLLYARREYGAAERYYREALAMCQKLYPPGRFPAGHRIRIEVTQDDDPYLKRSDVPSSASITSAPARLINIAQLGSTKNRTF